MKNVNSSVCILLICASVWPICIAMGQEPTEHLHTLGIKNATPRISWDEGRTRFNTYYVLEKQILLSAISPNLAILKIRKEQSRQLSTGFRQRTQPIQMELNKHAIDFLRAVDEGNKEKWFAISEQQIEPLQKRLVQAHWEFGSDVAEVLDDSQLEDLKGIAIGESISNYGGFLGLMQHSADEHEIDLSQIKHSQKLLSKLKRIEVEYQRELIRLQKKTADEFLDQLPDELKNSMLYSSGIENLRQLPK